MNMMNNNPNQDFFPATFELIQPICRNITAIIEEQQINPLVSHDNEPKVWKEEKKKCVHWIFEGPRLVPAVRPDENGEFKCRACGRTLYTKFDDNSGAEICMKFIDLVNSMVFFGMENKMGPERIETLIQLKVLIPKVAQEWNNMCEFIRRTSADKNSSNGALGEDFNIKPSITGMW